MRRRIYNVIIVIVFALFLTGCLSTSRINSDISPSLSLESFKTISIDVETKIEDSEIEVQKLRNMLIAEIKERNKWEVVDNNFSIKLIATITELKRADKADFSRGFSASFLAGAAADVASVVVNVEIIKSGDSSIISRFSASRKLKIETTEQVLQKAAEQIAAYMERGK